MLSQSDDVYYTLLNQIMKNGETVKTRNSVCKRMWGLSFNFCSTPLVTLRKTSWLTAIREMEWFLLPYGNNSNIKHAHEDLKKWWEPWLSDQGYLVNGYGDQLRGFHGVDGIRFDQIQYLLDSIKEHPYSRRAVITTWNTADMNLCETKITNCHGTVIQVFCDTNNKLHLSMYQRSADVICGLPHNWIQYWAFLLWLCSNCNKEVGTFQWIGGDIHIYEEHFDIVNEIIEATNEYQASMYNEYYDHTYVESPPPVELIYEPTEQAIFKACDFSLKGEYKPLVTTKAKMIV